MSADPQTPASSQPLEVATAAIEALLAGDMTRLAEVSNVSEAELEQFRAQGTSYPEMLEMMLMSGGPEQSTGETLMEAVERLYDGGFDELITGEVPKIGRIAVAILGSLDEGGERFLVVQLTPVEEAWRIEGLPKGMPKNMLDQLR